MTTYSYTLTLNDGEMIALEAALDLYLAHCNAQMKDGPCSPFFAHREYVRNLLARSHENVRQTSGRL